jgi:uncharacterized protein YjbJ (UPF0337 family)
MNGDIVEGKWKQLTGSAKEKWGKLTDNDLNEIKGSRENFVGKLQEKYGIKKEEAEQEWDKFTDENQ